MSLAWNIQGQANVYTNDVQLLGRFPKEMFPQGVTPRAAAANDPRMKSRLQENIVSQQSFADLDRWMERYQQADPEAPAALVGAPHSGVHRDERLPKPGKLVTRKHSAGDAVRATFS